MEAPNTSSGGTLSRARDPRAAVYTSRGPVGGKVGVRGVESSGGRQRAYDRRVLIPLGTERPSSRPARITPALIAVTVVAYLAMALLGAIDPEEAQRLEQTFWVVGGPGFRWWQPLTSTLLHGGLLHLAGNMLFLWVFGPSVEDRFGRLGFLLLYLGSAMLSGSLHALFARDHGLPVPAIGASGAIAGVTGAFLVLFPNTTIRCFALLGFGVVGLPAWWFVGFAILWDVFSQSMGVRTGIAHMAHLGGYAAGFGVAMLLLWLRVFPREPYDLFTIFRQAQRRREFRQAGALREHDQQRVMRSPTNTPSSASSSPPRPPAPLDPRREAIAQARTRVAKAVASGEFEAAGSAYTAMLDEFGADAEGTTLSRKAQYDLANSLFKAQDYTHAAHAYEAFLGAYPKDAEAPTVRLMLALIYARYLHQPAEAKPMLESVLPRLTDDQQALAHELLAEIA